jgi:hypothetical protein
MTKTDATEPSYQQDLHIHTAFSTEDRAIVPEQTVALVASIRHARVIGISDHVEFVLGSRFDDYAETVRGHGLRLGVELDRGAAWVAAAAELPVDYYVYHCVDHPDEYRGAERLLELGKPVIIAHPLLIGTDPGKLPPECLIEINNRYVWRSDWREGYRGFLERFRFVLGSDAHQPHWLSLEVARAVARSLNVEETLLGTGSLPVTS